MQRSKLLIEKLNVRKLEGSPQGAQAGKVLLLFPHAVTSFYALVDWLNAFSVPKDDMRAMLLNEEFVLILGFTNEAVVDAHFGAAYAMAESHLRNKLSGRSSMFVGYPDA